MGHAPNAQPIQSNTLAKLIRERNTGGDHSLLIAYSLLRMAEALDGLEMTLRGK